MRKQNHLLYEPTIYNPKKSKEKEELENLLKSNFPIQINDEIISQIEELIKLENPTKKFNKKELATAVKDHLGRTNINNYGLWIYYPWKNTLVHTLNEQDFIRVRTNRNQYKITKEEQDALQHKKVGIIGLSVGQSVALTLAMERACGELRLCDFDILELSNYNRIRTSLCNLGVPKTIATAREIKEIDPFIKITCYNDGLTTENIDDFFIKDGRLDICIDECDGIDIKILCRQKAKQYKIPVVMETSDNCTIDVERFDLEPERSLLHGYMDHLDLDKAKNLKTNEEKVPYVLAILGPEFMTSRMLASMFEIEETITTWPQLASSVIYGGGICGNVCRRILLKTFTDSGRYQLNVDDYFGNSKKEEEIELRKISRIKPSRETMIKQTEALTPIETPAIINSNVLTLTTNGGKAPSGGNMQPWLWHFSEKHGLVQFIDKSKQSVLLDYKYRGSLVGLGAAAENVILSANKIGANINTEFLAHSLDNNDLICRFLPEDSITHPYPELVKYIDSRVTNRKLGERTPIKPTTLNTLKSRAESIPGANLRILTEPDQLDQIGQIFSQVELARITDLHGHKDFMEEIRWSEKEEKASGNGVNVWSFDIDNKDFAGLNACKQRSALETIRTWEKGSKFINLFKKSIDSAGAIGLLTMPTNSNENLFNCGKALQRVWLTATAESIAFQPISPVTFMFYCLSLEQQNLVDKETYELLKQIKPKFDKLFNLQENEESIFMFRLAKTDKEAVKSYREEPETLLTFQS